MVVLALLYMSAALLALGGVAKVLRPTPAREAMRAVGLPAPFPLVVALGLFEVLVGLGVVLTAARLLIALMALSYAGFALFVVAAMRAGEQRSCGCFGEASAPPGVLHLVVDSVAGVVAMIAVFHPVESFPAVMAAQPALGLPFLLLWGVATYLLVATMTVLPHTSRAVAQLAVIRRGSA